MEESTLLLTKNLMVYDQELDESLRDFCGRIMKYTCVESESDTQVYICGDITKIYESIRQKCRNCKFYAVGDYDHSFTQINNIDSGCVPIHIHGLGIYFRKLFENDNYRNICDEHLFSELTESNKPNNAFRKGVYLSNVEKETETLSENGDVVEKYKFNLLRCSTNFQFPTENFRKTDIEIIRVLNEQCGYYFDKPFCFNHVLAQIYENRIVDKKQKKARISAHSDKTKDMPQNALMAFCTFYDNINSSCYKKHGLDYQYKGASVLTKLVFHKKKGVSDNFIDKFEVTLYPNSAFVIPLSTNRLYKHEICPSTLDIDQIPTRMGYVVRCSKTMAVHKNAKTYILDHENNEREMREMTCDEFSVLKILYFDENTSHEIITYPFFSSSMNQGDYLQPVV